LIVIDLGDTGRALRRYGWGSEPIRLALEREDENLGLILKDIDWGRTRLFLLSPTANIIGKHPFAPIVAFGAGVPNGLLWSATTSQRGLVCNIDLAPSILDFLGVAKPLFYGRQMLFKPAGGGRFSEIEKREGEGSAVIQIRSIVVTMLVFCVFFSLLLAVLSLRYNVLTGVARLGLVLCVGFVFGVVVVPMFLPMRYGLAPTLGVLLMVASTTLLIPPRRVELFLGGLGVVMFILLCVDQLAGTNLTLDTPLGSSSVAALRFYGIGNDIMSFLLASIMLFLPLSLRGQNPLRKGAILAIVILFVGTSLLNGLPTLGANAGGALTIGATFALALALLIRGRIGWQGWMAAGILALVFLGICLLVDLHRPASVQTHLGRNVAYLEQGGVAQMMRVIAGKLSLNKRMLTSSVFTPFFVPIFLAFFWVVLRPAGIIKKLFLARPHFHHCLKAAMIGSVIGALTNDSGVIIPLLVFSLMAPATFLLALTPSITGGAADPYRLNPDEAGNAALRHNL
jgi:hypothetical protein